MGLANLKPKIEPKPECRLFAPSRNGDGVKCGVPENLLASIRQIVREEIRAGLQEEAQKRKSWIQYFFEKLRN